MERVLAAALREAEWLKLEMGYWRARAKTAEAEAKEWMRLTMQGEALRNQQMLAVICGVDQFARSAP